MEEFNTKEKVEELFRNVNGLGENNCIFLCFLDTNREGLKYGALGALTFLIFEKLYSQDWLNQLNRLYKNYY